MKGNADLLGCPVRSVTHLETFRPGPVLPASANSRGVIS